MPLVSAIFSVTDVQMGLVGVNAAGRVRLRETPLNLAEWGWDESLAANVMGRPPLIVNKRSRCNDATRGPSSITMLSTNKLNLAQHRQWLLLHNVDPHVRTLPLRHQEIILQHDHCIPAMYFALVLENWHPVRQCGCRWEDQKCNHLPCSSFPSLLQTSIRHVTLCIYNFLCSLFQINTPMHAITNAPRSTPEQPRLLLLLLSTSLRTTITFTTTTTRNKTFQQPNQPSHMPTPRHRIKHRHQ